VHRLAQIEVFHALHRVVRLQHPIEKRARSRVLAALLRRQDHDRPSVERHQGGVERVGRDGVGERKLVLGGDLDGHRAPHEAAQTVRDRGAVEKRNLVHHQKRVAAHAEHVGMERAGVDSARMLLGEDDATRREQMTSRQRFRRFPRLTGGKPPHRGGLAEARSPPGEEVHGRLLGR
jgi:hypothetical protein